jgi:hypothetical protein
MNVAQYNVHLPLKFVQFLQRVKNSEIYLENYIALINLKRRSNETTVGVQPRRPISAADQELWPEVGPRSYPLHKS